MITRPATLYPRLTIGEHQMGGFAGLSDGDCFRDIFGNLWMNCNQTLRPVMDGKPNFHFSHPQFTNWNGYSDFVQRVNYYANNPEELKNPFAAFGINKDKPLDAIAYQKKLRKEWE